MDAILISALEFYGFHGASDEEQQVGHRYRVDIRLMLDTRPAAATDDVTDTVNYAEVAATVLRIGTTHRHRLIETLAHIMISTIFAEYSRVEGVKIVLRKMLPPLNAIVESVGVEIARSREQAVDTQQRADDATSGNYHSYSYVMRSDNIS